MSKVSKIADPMRQVLDRLRVADLDSARAKLCEALAAVPGDPETTHYLGLVSAWRDDADSARRLIAQSVQLRPGYPPFMDNYLVFLSRQGLTDADRAIVHTWMDGCDPDTPAFVDWATRLYSIDGPDLGMPWVEIAAGRTDNSNPVLLAAGEALLGRGDAERALALGRRALAGGQETGGWTLVAEAARALEAWADATDAYRRLAGLLPNDPAPLVNLGRCFLGMRNPTAAASAYEAALVRAPGLGQALMGLIDCTRNSAPGSERRLAALRRGVTDARDRADRDQAVDGLIHEASARSLEAAAAEADRVLADIGAGDRMLQRRVAAALSAVGANLAARRIYDALLQAAPVDADVICDRAILDLRTGRIAEGWAGYEKRWDAARFDAARRPFPQPQWHGGPVPGGKRVLIWAEQGIGDEILYGAMLRDAAAVASIVLECDGRLAGLFADALPNIETVPFRPDPDSRLFAEDIAAQLPIGSLGRLFRPDRERLWALSEQVVTPWLASSADAITAARRKLASLGPRPWIGLTWGSGNAAFGPAKSLDPGPLAALLQKSGGTLFCLQYGDVGETLVRCRADHGATIHSIPEFDRFHDLNQQAGLLRAADLTVSASNSTAHLAGALHAPIWTLLPKGAGLLWYWFETGEVVPWYPTMRIFRQRRPGDWPSALSALEAALRFWSWKTQ